MKTLKSYPAFLIFLMFVSFSLMFTGCDLLSGDSDSEGDTIAEGEDDSSDDSDSDSSGSDSVTSPVSGYDLAVNSGSYWEFYWEFEESSGWTSSYDSNSTSSEDQGFVTLTLGDSKSISGKTLYALELTGDIPERWVSGYWEYLGVDNTSIIGSKDGFTLETIINGTTGKTENGFFGFFTAEQDITQSSSFSAETPVEYFTSADKSSFSTSYDESIYLPGYGSFSGDEGNYYNSEYYKPGIGPLGYYESDYWRQEDSSTDSYWGRHSWSFNLTGTNLSALDGFALPQAPWSIYGEMPNTREEPNVVEANGTLYLLGGENGSYSPNLTFHEEQSDGSWGTLNSPTPTTWYSTAATVRDTGTTSGEMIIFISDAYNPAIYSYNTIFDSWNSIGSYSTTNDLYDCFMWGDDLLYMILGSTIVGYQFSTDEFLDSIYLDSDFSHMSVITHGDYIYIVGQYLVSGGGIFNLDYVYSTRIQYYDGAWSALGFTADSERRWCPGLAIYNNRLYVFGGTTDGTHVISASIAAGPPSDWQSHSSMLYGGTYLEAVVRGEEILVFGCDEGTKIEVYRPEND